MAQRQTLTSLEINRNYGNELSPFQRDQIFVYKVTRLLMNKINVQVNCKRTTVFNTLIQNPFRKKNNSLLRSERLSILNRI